MRYLLVSDIHGSLDSALIIKQKHEQLKTDKIIVLGDILYHGPRNDLPPSYNPKKVIEVLNELKDDIIAIKGNCDAEVDQMVLDFKIYDDFVLNYKGKKIYLTHGQKINKDSPIIDNKYSVVLYGHSHVYCVKMIEKVMYINLGSITIPKENTKKCYGVLEDDNIKVFDTNDNLLMVCFLGE